MFQWIAQRLRSDTAVDSLRSLGVSPENAVSIGEIPDVLGVSSSSAYRYVKRPDFPEPLAITKAGVVWLRKDVERWGREHLPLKEGRPKKEAGNG
jgi:predicted DNA-binding transcriptional regulator AlpA